MGVPPSAVTRSLYDLTSAPMPESAARNLGIMVVTVLLSQASLPVTAPTTAIDCEKTTVGKAVANSNVQKIISSLMAFINQKPHSCPTNIGANGIQKTKNRQVIIVVVR